MVGIYASLYLIAVFTEARVDPAHASECGDVKRCDTSLLKFGGLKRLKTQILHDVLISGVFEECSHSDS